MQRSQAKKSPNPTDKYVGSRVRMRRKMLSMSQEKLGDALGLTFQQVQKYEKGTNRIGASRLQNISHILQVPVSFFFEGTPTLPGVAIGKGAAPSPSYVNAEHLTVVRDALVVERPAGLLVVVRERAVPQQTRAHHALNPLGSTQRPPAPHTT